jgi:GNAT superfamily N-acetyltransferase
MVRWGAAVGWADGSLPAPSVYGIPDCWPHVRRVLERSGFAPGERVEAIVAAPVAALPRPGHAPLDGLQVRRRLGTNATRLEAVDRGGDVVAFTEVRTDLTAGGALSRLAGWADVWDLEVHEPLRRRGLGRWLLGHVAAWLELAGTRMLLAETALDDGDGGLRFLRACGFVELTRTTRGWTHQRP